jgi:hypothetical protein
MTEQAISLTEAISLLADGGYTVMFYQRKDGAVCCTAYTANGHKYSGKGPTPDAALSAALPE